MPLTFVDKKKRWPPSKPVQYILAGIALITALAILTAWLFLRFVYTDPTKDTDQNETIPPTKDPLPGIAYCVIILEDNGIERFALIKADPAANTIHVSPITPSNEYNGASLSSVLRKNGPAQTVSAISSLLDVPVSHYFSLSTAKVLDLATDLGNNLPFDLPEDISYQDENAATVQLTTGQHSLTPKQIVAILRYTQWAESENYINVLANLTVSLINQYMVPDCSLSRYFKLLSQTTATNIRIDHFNAYQYGLEHLAAANSGALATLTP